MPTTAAHVARERMNVDDAPLAQRRTWEFVGPAGAGKSTVLRRLAERNRLVCAAPRLPRMLQLAAALTHSRALAPQVVLLAHGGPRRFPTTLRYAVRLLTQRDLVLWAAARHAAGPIVLDEGPVFTLAMLRALGPSPDFEPFWQAARDRWSRELHTIVWFDAVDAVLARRIALRAKEHQVKTRSESAIREFVARHREIYQAIIPALTRSGVRLVSVDSGTTTPEAIVDELDAIIGGDRVTGADLPPARQLSC